MAYRHIGDEQYFGTMDIPLALGRGFRRSDSHGGPSVVIVNEALARRYLAGTPAGGCVRLRETPSRNRTPREPHAAT